MARKAKKPEAPENHERWLITYSDLITLLLIFFVIMYAMSQVDKEKYNMLSQSLHRQFAKADSVVAQNGAGKGVVGALNPEPSPANPTPPPISEEEKKAKAEREKREAELQNLLAVIQEYIQVNHLEATVSATDTERGIAVTLKDYFLFDLGKADLKPGAYPILDKLASLVPQLNAKISIEGHTDDLPLSTGALYRDNWRLSSERSLSVLRYFTEQSKLPTSTFMSVAYADTRPIAPNTSEANRQKNRRVEIVVLR